MEVLKEQALEMTPTILSPNMPADSDYPTNSSFVDLERMPPPMKSATGAPASGSFGESSPDPLSSTSLVYTKSTENSGETNHDSSNPDTMPDPPTKGVSSAPVEAPRPKPLPCQPVVLEFENLTYDVPVVVKGKGLWGVPPLSTATSIQQKITKSTSTKRLIHNVSGTVRPGDLVALMGASGAGKSTLLNILSRRILKNGGSVKYNGKPTDFGFIRLSAFVQQEDIFFGFITVQEHLKFQAELRVPRVSIENETINREERVRKLMRIFGLEKIANNNIGNVMMGARRGISGGEKKRLNVATELLTNPSVIFADEPTSGLDSFMADSVVSVLQRLAENGRTILTTIHQPSSEVFQMFNKLLLLAEGRIVYFGDRLGAVPYFMRLGQVCPPYRNPADFFIEILALPPTGEARALKMGEIDGWVKSWNDNGQAFLTEWESSLKAQFLQVATLVPTAERETSVAKLSDSQRPAAVVMNEEKKEREEERRFMDVARKKLQERKREYAASWNTQFSVLLRRSMLNNSRNPLLFRARLAQTILTAIICGFVYFRLPVDRVLSKNGCCFFLVLTQALIGSLGVVQVFTVEAPVALREYYSGTYSILAYFWAKVCSDLPFQLLNPLLFTCIVWFMTGLNDNGVRFILAVVVCLLVTNAAISIGYLVSAVSPTLPVAVAINPIITMPMTLVSGFMIILSTIPSFWIWLEWISPFKWAWSGLMIVTWKNVELFPCSPDQVTCFESGNEVLDYWALGNNTLWGDCVALLVQTVVYRIIAMFLLMIRTAVGKRV